jgi:Fe-S-cluster-containing hydrogenase component 2
MTQEKKRGLIPVIECWEEIPCNPCKDACPFGAIRIEGEMTNLPIFEEALCKSCKKCVFICPGQAIYMLDEDYTESEGRILFPYEFRPLPEKDAMATGLNRQGQPVCPVKILEVDLKTSYKMTPLVTIAVPKEHLKEVRFIQLPGGEG